MGRIFGRDKKKPDSLDTITPEFDKMIFGDSYDLIWRSLTGAEKDLVKLIVFSKSGKVSEIKASMSNPQSFDTLRQRLRNKHLISTEDRGYVKINLPRFKEYIMLWHDD